MKNTIKILLIEDDVTLAELLTKRLTTEGYIVVAATDGGIGLEMIKTEMPTLILLDILLPTLNGYEILEAKRNDPAIKHIPVLIISNSGQPVELERAIALGANDYFIKAQIDPADIIAKVEAMLPKTENTTSISEKKILLVEDDTFLSDLLSKKLIDEKCTVFRAMSGESALEVADKEVPDMILLDLVLPGISGFDTLQKIRENPKTKDAYVVVLSNLSLQADIDKVKALGGNDFLVKAESTPSEIFSKIKSILQK